MPVTVSMYRLSLELAVDILSKRAYVVECEIDDKWENQFKPFWWLPLKEDMSDEVPRQISLGNDVSLALSILTGEIRHPRDLDYYAEVSIPSNPLWWSIYGSRRVGWKDTDFPPYFYTLPTDYAAVDAALAEVSLREMIENGEAHFNANPDFYKNPDRISLIRDGYVRSLRPILRGFYQAAAAENQVVLNRMA